MIQTISLTENDYLNFQLFSASKSIFFNRRLYSSWIVIVVIFLSASIYLYSLHNAAAYYCLAISLLLAPFYPIVFRWLYKRFYQKYIKENYKDSLGLMFIIEFKDDFLLLSDDTTESKTKITELDEINETGKYFFIKLKNRQSVIIPKIQLRGAQFINELEVVAKQVSAKINRDLAWKWQ